MQLRRRAVGAVCILDVVPDDVLLVHLPRFLSDDPHALHAYALALCGCRAFRVAALMGAEPRAAFLRRANGRIVLPRAPPHTCLCTPDEPLGNAVASGHVSCARRAIADGRYDADAVYLLYEYALAHRRVASTLPVIERAFGPFSLAEFVATQYAPDTAPGLCDLLVQRTATNDALLRVLARRPIVVHVAPALARMRGADAARTLGVLARYVTTNIISEVIRYHWGLFDAIALLHGCGDAIRRTAERTLRAVVTPVMWLQALHLLHDAALSDAFFAAPIRHDEGIRTVCTPSLLAARCVRWPRGNWRMSFAWRDWGAYARHNAVPGGVNGAALAEALRARYNSGARDALHRALRASLAEGRISLQEQAAPEYAMLYEALGAFCARRAHKRRAVAP